MTEEELKKYTVIVDGGSGCLFQPMLSENEYTYVLTAKHLFEGTSPDNDGNDLEYSTDNNQEIEILRLDFRDNVWVEVPIAFNFIRGETYFPHEEADAAILKVPFLDCFGKIVTSPMPENATDYNLHGYRSDFRNKQVGDKDRKYTLNSFAGVGVNSQIAQLVNATMTHKNIVGMSGGGILRKVDKQISVIGVQSQMAHEEFAAGQIHFVPIQSFEEITEYEEFNDLLAPLAPPYIGNFQFLRDEVFTLEVDDFDEENVASVRITLRNKASVIIDSDITPIGIRRLFEKRLLITESEDGCFSFKHIWIAWLEFLTILNIVKFDPIDESMLSDIFDNFRLMYVDTDDWTSGDIRERYGAANYKGLQANSTIYVGSKGTPRNRRRIRKGKMINIARPYDTRGFKTDSGINPFTSFEFVHLDSFKTESIIHRLNEFRGLNELQVLERIKEYYNEFFN